MDLYHPIGTAYGDLASLVDSGRRFKLIKPHIALVLTFSFTPCSNRCPEKVRTVKGSSEKVDCKGRKYIFIICSVGYWVEVLYPAPIVTPFLFWYDYL